MKNGKFNICTIMLIFENREWTLNYLLFFENSKWYLCASATFKNKE